MIKSWAIFLTAVVMSFLLPQSYDGINIGYTMIYAMGILLLTSIFTILSAPFFIRFTGSLDNNRLSKEEAASYRLELKNKGLFFYPAIKYIFHNPEFTNYQNRQNSKNILPFGQESRIYSINIPYTGLYDVGVEKIVVSDFLGLFRRTISLKDNPKVLVYPRSDSGFSVFLQRDAESVPLDIRSYNENYEDIIDVRNYVPSDSLKKVHWKLSAKRSELLVKNYPSMASRKLTLFVDTKKIPLANKHQRLAFEDGILSRVTAAVSFCVETQQHAELLYHNKKVEIRSADDLNQACEQVAMVDFNSVGSGIIEFAHSISESIAPMTLMCFTSFIDSEVAAVVERMVAMDHSVFLYYFIPDSIIITAETKNEIENLELMGITIHKISIKLPSEAGETMSEGGMTYNQ